MKRRENPNYKKIYVDLLDKKYPDIKDDCKVILKKEILNFVDVINLNKIISHRVKNQDSNDSHKYRSYDPDTIVKILKDQRDHNLNNSELACKFKVSLTSIRKWKRIFKI